jgi:hypothetical protein
LRATLDVKLEQFEGSRAKAFGPNRRGR